jgi:hypothetical protein
VENCVIRAFSVGVKYSIIPWMQDPSFEVKGRLQASYENACRIK